MSFLAENNKSLPHPCSQDAAVFAAPAIITAARITTGKEPAHLTATPSTSQESSWYLTRRTTSARRRFPTSSARHLSKAKRERYVGYGCHKRHVNGSECDDSHSRTDLCDRSIIFIYRSRLCLPKLPSGWLRKCGRREPQISPIRL